MQAPSDPWFGWLTEARHGQSGELREQVLREIHRIRDRVLDGARLSRGMTLVDVGTGDGLVAFGALERLGGDLKVVMTDVSRALLDLSAQTAAERGFLESCRFVEGSAESLAGIDSGSADAVCTRSVLAYVADKPTAIREFHRVLKPGGRLSMAEPIFRDQALEVETLVRVLAARPARPAERALRLFARWQAAQFPSTLEAIQNAPITNFSERNLVTFCESAGFGEIHMELHVDRRRKLMMTWDAFLDHAPHPLAPTLREVLQRGFSAGERLEFEGFFRPEVESKVGYEKVTCAYLTAQKT